MLQVYSLSPIGKGLARSTSAPNNPNYKVIFWLDKVGRSTIDGIAQNTGMSKAEVAVVIRRLRFNKVVKEDTEVMV